jgi:hypothetical protein
MLSNPFLRLSGRSLSSFAATTIVLSL